MIKNKIKIGFLIFLLCINPVSSVCETGYNATWEGYTCFDIDALNHNNFGIDVCYGHNDTCISYLENETLPLNISFDYIIKITPIKIVDSREYVTYFNTRLAWFNIVMVFVMIFTFYALLKILAVKQR